jgi:hypothetical protein
LIDIPNVGVFKRFFHLFLGSIKTLCKILDESSETVGQDLSHTPSRMGLSGLGESISGACGNAGFAISAKLFTG